MNKIVTIIIIACILFYLGFMMLKLTVGQSKFLYNIDTIFNKVLSMNQNSFEDDNTVLASKQ